MTIEGSVLDLEGRKKRTRSENKFRKTESRDGVFSCKFGKKTSERITRYCKLNNLNRTKFCDDHMNNVLDVLEREHLASLSKEELIEMILTGK